MDLVGLCMLSLFSKEMFVYYIKMFHPPPPHIPLTPLKCISDDHASRNMDHNQSKNCENLYVCPLELNDLMIYTENWIKLNFVANSVIYAI